MTDTENRRRATPVRPDRARSPGGTMRESCVVILRAMITPHRMGTNSSIVILRAKTAKRDGAEIHMK